MGFYQRYEDTRLETKGDLSADTVAGGPSPSRFPPGVEPAALMAPDDHAAALTGDTFAMVQGGGVPDIAQLTATHASYAARVQAEPELSLGDRSQTLGPAQAARFAPMLVLPPDAGGGQAPHEDEDCPDHSTPMLLSSLGGTLPAAVSSDCGLGEGHRDQDLIGPTLPGTTGEAVPPAVPAEPVDPATPAEPVQPPPPAEDTETEPTDDGSVDPRTESGSRERGSVLTGFITCARETIEDLLALIGELLSLAGGGIAAAWEKWGPGWWTDDDADEEFAREIREIRQALLDTARDGLELLAALHVHYRDTLEGSSAFRALTRALELFFEPEEWEALAAEGREAAAEIAAHYQQLWEEDADYAVGYLVCTVGAMFVGGGALLRIIRQIRGRRGGGGDSDAPDADTETDTGDPQAPENILDDPDGVGANTPNGPVVRQQEGAVQPEYLPSDDPDAVQLDGGTPSDGGVPVHGRPGSYEGDSLDEIREGASPNLQPSQLEDLLDESRSGQDLAGAGYHVEQLDRRNQPHPGLQEGDYGHAEGSTKEPDFRINGVIFDHFSLSSPNPMAIVGRIEGKLNNLQARNFVVRIGRNGGPEISEYLQALRSMDEPRLGQVIIIDGRTGRIATWTNPQFDPG